MDRMQPPPYYGSPYQGEMPPSSYPYPTPGERKEDSEPTATELSGFYGKEHWNKGLYILLFHRFSPMA